MVNRQNIMSGIHVCQCDNKTNKNFFIEYIFIIMEFSEL